MTSYTTADVNEFFLSHRNKFQFYLVAHTSIRPSKLSAPQLVNRLYAAKQDLRHALNVFAAKLHPSHHNLPRRNPHRFRPLTLVTIEAIDTAQVSELTAHFNIILGNIPPGYREAELLEKAFAEIWEHLGHGSDVKVAEVDRQAGLEFYVLKEAHRDNSRIFDDISTWDIENSFVPTAAAYAD